MTLIAIGLGGAVGALLRYGIALWTKNWLSQNGWIPFSHFPFGTFLANIIGAFCMGALYYTFQRVPLSEPFRVLLTTGFLGALTTFSTFALEGVNLWRAGSPGMAVIYVLVTNLTGLLSIGIGMFCIAFISSR